MILEKPRTSLNRLFSSRWAAGTVLALLVGGALWGVSADRITGARQTVSLLVWIGFVSGIGFLILVTGRLARWRSVFFVTLAWGFLLNFKAALLGLSGRGWISPSAPEVPTCHIAIVSSIFNTAYQQILALQSERWALWGPLSLGALWIVVTLALGTGFCSWGCPYGGLDEGFSRLAKRPFWKSFRLPARWRDLPAAVWVFTALVSLATMLPIFCLWMCPLKISTAFLDTGNPITRALQVALFSILGIGALVVGPILLKKRVFCGLICPFGAWQAFWGRAHPLRVTIAHDRCTGCGICASVCPTFCIHTPEKSSGAPGRGLTRILSYCNRCGECVDACPEGAVHFTWWNSHRPWPREGTGLGALWTPRAALTFSGLLVGGSLGALFVPALLERWSRVLWP